MTQNVTRRTAPLTTGLTNTQPTEPKVTTTKHTVVEPAAQWTAPANAQVVADGAPLAVSQTPASLWGDQDPVSQLGSAINSQPQAELAKTLGRAAIESPKTYRAALRGALEEHLKDASRLTRHLTMLDINGDGSINIGENFKTLRQLGMNGAQAVLVAGGSQLALLFSTRKTVGFTVDLKNADQGRHKTVDTGAMDAEADLTKKLDEMMSEDLNGDGVLTMSELGNLLDKRAAASNANGIVKALIKAANKAEFSQLFALVGGTMSRDDLRDFYTGSLFFSLLPPDALAQRLVLLRQP